DVVADDRRDRHPFLVAEVNQLLDQVADGEVRRIALAAVAELFTQSQCFEIGTIQRLESVPESGQRRRHQRVVGDRQAAEQDGRGVALVTREYLRVGVVPVI